MFAGVLGGAVAAIAGVGIGSLLTRAIAAVSTPHLTGTAIAIGAAGVCAGTLSGERLLSHVPEHRFRTLVGVLLLALGASFIL